MLVNFLRPDGTEITSGGTSNGSCSIDDVKSAVKQAYGKVVSEEIPLGEDKLPMIYCTEILGANVRDFNTAGDKCITIVPYNGMGEVKIVPHGCFPTHACCMELMKYENAKEDSVAPCKACNNEGMKFGERVAVAAAEGITNFGK